MTDEKRSPRARRGLVAGALVFAAMLALPAPTGLEAPAWRAAAVGVLMAIWWMSEALPIPATALLPLVLFPLLGIAPLGETASPYANPLIFLFMGGFMIALAMERWQLHRRLALGVIHRVGTRPGRIVAGFMIASAGLSMWISNTATAMMMLPIGTSVVALTSGGRDEHVRHEHVQDQRGQGGNFAIVLMLSIAYACSIGGLATLVGTPPNALLAGFLLEAYGFELGFLDWFRVGLPLAIVGLVACFYALTRWVYPLELEAIPGGRELIAGELAKLGPWKPGERRVAIVFALVAGLWMTRPWLEAWIPGLSDPGIAIAGALALFAIPIDWRRGLFTLDWHTARRLPWGVLLLFGGGLSLASAINDTGLAAWIGGAMGGLGSWPVVILTLTVVAVIVLLTELTSNTATAAAFLPVLGSVAIGLGQNPLLLLAPAALGASCAFMLPVATPPNAIVYGSGEVTIPQMVRAGIVLNLVFIALVTLVAYTLVPWVLGVELGVLPAWAQ